MVLVEKEREEYYQNNDNIDIIEADVLAYLVWIPRYRYQLFNVDSLEIKERKIEIILKIK